MRESGTTPDQYPASRAAAQFAGCTVQDRTARGFITPAPVPHTELRARSLAAETADFVGSVLNLHIALSTNAQCCINEWTAELTAS